MGWINKMRITKEGLIGYSVNDMVYIKPFLIQFGTYSNEHSGEGFVSIIDIDINSSDPYCVELYNENKDHRWINAKYIDHQRTLANMFK